MPVPMSPKTAKENAPNNVRMLGSLTPLSDDCLLEAGMARSVE